MVNNAKQYNNSKVPRIIATDRATLLFSNTGEPQVVFLERYVLGDSILVRKSS